MDHKITDIDQQLTVVNTNLEGNLKLLLERAPLQMPVDKVMSLTEDIGEE